MGMSVGGLPKYKMTAGYYANDEVLYCTGRCLNLTIRYNSPEHVYLPLVLRYWRMTFSVIVRTQDATFAPIPYLSAVSNGLIGLLRAWHAHNTCYRVSGLSFNETSTPFLPS